MAETIEKVEGLDPVDAIESAAEVGSEVVDTSAVPDVAVGDVRGDIAALSLPTALSEDDQKFLADLLKKSIEEISVPTCLMPKSPSTSSILDRLVKGLTAGQVAFLRSKHEKGETVRVFVEPKLKANTMLKILAEEYLIDLGIDEWEWSKPEDETFEAEKCIQRDDAVFEEDRYGWNVGIIFDDIRVDEQSKLDVRSRRPFPGVDCGFSTLRQELVLISEVLAKHPRAEIFRYVYVHSDAAQMRDSVLELTMHPHNRLRSPLNSSMALHTLRTSRLHGLGIVRPVMMAE